jgi:C4-dicarboxylate-specific signal transduction histidine kinase
MLSSSLPREAQGLRPSDWMNTAVWDELVALTGALAVYFAVISVAHWFVLPPAAARVMAPLAAASSGILLATCVAIRRRGSSNPRSQLLAFFVGCVALTNCAVHLWLLGKPEDSTNFAIVMAASGWLMLSRRWLLIVVILIWGTWGAVVYSVQTTGNWTHYAFFLLAATALGVIVQSARRNLIGRVIRAETDRRLLVDHLEEVVVARTRELQQSQDQLRHSERLASIGTLAAGIAHEINNPLGLMLLTTERIKCQFGAAATEADAQRLFDEQTEYIQRCARIVKNVLRFSGEQPTERWAEDVNVTIWKAVALTTVYAKERDALIETKLDPSLPPVLMNPLEIEQVLVNLINNGIEAGAAAPHVVVHSSQVGEVVRLVVSDNGPGVSDETRAKMFDPFYTTRRTEGGTGLGLSLAYGIVADHGGTIRVDNRRASGLTVIIELPVATASSDTLQAM